MALLDIIIILLTFVVLYRLYSVLGRRDYDPRQDENFVEMVKKQQQKLDDVQLAVNRERDQQQATDPRIPKHLQNTVLAIRQIDPDFAIGPFLIGAEKAFEIIISAFASGNQEDLKELTSRDVLANFCKAIDVRMKQKLRLVTSIVSIDSIKVKDIRLERKKAYITVQITSEQVNAEQDENDNVIGGDLSAVENVTDIWTFCRDLTSRDPNWRLVSTR